MRDTLSKQHRSWNMSRISSRNTKPELIVRSALHKLGYRFRIHNKKLFGTPDIVLAKYKTVIFVHGCFWHRHKGCKRCTSPGSNKEYWEAKFARNLFRDRQDQHNLKKAGWKVIVIWECQTAKTDQLIKKLKSISHL